MLSRAAYNPSPLSSSDRLLSLSLSLSLSAVGQVRVFPPIKYTFLDSQFVLLLCMLVWFYLFRCVVTPMCGESSRYFVNAAPWMNLDWF